MDQRNAQINKLKEAKSSKCTHGYITPLLSGSTTTKKLNSKSKTKKMERLENFAVGARALREVISNIKSVQDANRDSIAV